MNEEQKELLLDLLTQKALYGLTEAEQAQLDQLDDGSAELEFRSLEMTTAAIGMAGLDEIEEMPAHLRSIITANYEKFADASEVAEAAPWPPAERAIVKEKRSTPWFSWLGWAAAAAACVALAVNIWFTRTQPVERAGNPPPVDVPKTLSMPEQRDELMRSATDMVKAAWSVGNMTALSEVVGDVVWSDQKQAGYMKLKGLPVNDKSKETYQLWIFDKTQDPKTPIDGGTFDVNSEGEVVIPINAKLKAQGPAMFAITVEKPGGVVVSSRGKIAALAKVETQNKPTA